VSTEATYSGIAANKVNEALKPSLYAFGRKVDTLAQEMLDKDKPEQNERRLKELQEMAVAIRVFLDYMR
jgi:hypothetical protein